MKILIAYSSVTGNTEKIAKALYECCENADLLKIKDVKSFDKYDLIIIGGWIAKGDFNQEVKDRLVEIKNKNVGFFFTLGAYPTGVHAYKCLDTIKNSFLKNNNKILGHFHCMGRVSQGLRDKMLKYPEGHSHFPDKDRLKRWEISDTHPNEEDIFGAKHAMASILKKYKKEKLSNNI